MSHCYSNNNSQSSVTVTCCLVQTTQIKSFLHSFCLFTSSLYEAFPFSVTLVMKQHFQITLYLSLSLFALAWFSSSILQSANQDPAACHPMSLFSRLNIWPMLNPFTRQSAINMTCSMLVYSRFGRWVCVEKHFPTSTWLHPLFLII